MKLKPFAFATLLALSSANVFADGTQLAFPGADGYAKYITGGRGGEVCYVTRLDDCTDNNLVPGTLRWAIRHDNGGKPRTILFATSGTIYLTSKLKLQYPNVSILGQSAPGGGICLAGYNMYICKDNVIVRYIRFRAGDIPNSSMTGLDIENCKNIMLDHCSMTWSMEECLTAYDTDNTTVQWCIIGEGLYSSKNAKGARAYAMQWGGEHSTMHHTLVTNSHSRSPRFNGVRSKSSNKGDHDYHVDSEFANNVIFNWSGTGAIYGGEYAKDAVEVAGSWTDADKGYDRVYMINNYFRPGPSSKVNNTKPTCASPSAPYGQWYFNGNKFEESGTYTPWSSDQAKAANDRNYANGLPDEYLLSEVPYALSGLQYESAEDGYAAVVTKAGASLPRYDEVDRRLLDEAAGKVNPKYVGATLRSNNEFGIIDSPDDVKLANPGMYYADGVAYNNYPSLALAEGEKYMIDADSDGMPDGYEDAMGFNKNDASDGNAVAANGYTNLENYLNGIVDGTIDKSKYETSNVMVVPGKSEAPEHVTVTYKCNDSAVKGSVPASVTINYGESTVVPVNTSLYKPGYTLTGWQGGGFNAGGGNKVMPLEDITLTPVFTANKASLSGRTAPVVAIWKGVDASSNLTVTRADINGASIDLAINPSDRTIYDYKGDVNVTANGADLVAFFPFKKEVAGVSGAGKVAMTWTWGGNVSDNCVFSPSSVEGAFASVKGIVNETGFSAVGSKSVSGKSCVALTPKRQETIMSATSKGYVEMTVTPAEGMKFKATSITWNGAFCGTDAGNYAVATLGSDAKPVFLQRNIAPSRDNLQAYSYEFADAALSGEPFVVRIYIYNYATTKQSVIRDIVINGEYEGTAAAPVAYTVTALPYTSGTGSVTLSPKEDAYTAGKSVTLTATPADGCFFEKWMTADGTVLGTEPELTITTDKDHVIFADIRSEKEYAYIFENTVFDAEVNDINGLKIALREAKNRSDQNKRYLIFLHNGDYDFANVAKTYVPQNTSLIGESQQGVIISNSPANVSNYQEDTPVLFIDQNQNNVYMQDLTIRQARDWDAKTSAGQAIALRQRGKKAAYKNVTIQGVQDTYYINKADATAYFETSTLAGEVDFIYGDGTVWFEQCNLHPVSSNAVIAASNAQPGYTGMVFNDCVVEPEPTAKGAVTGYALGRPWNDSPAVAYLNTTMKAQPLAAGWKGMKAGLVCRLHEYGSKDANGNAIDLSKRSLSACDAAAGSLSPVMTADEAAAYTLSNTFADWNPQELTAQIAAPQPVYDAEKTMLSWTKVNGAIGYAVCQDGVVKAFTTGNSYAIAGDNLAIRAINAMGGLGAISPIAVKDSDNGIEVITDTDSQRAKSTATFNLAGQRVGKNAKGIVVRNGKKYLTN